MLTSCTCVAGRPNSTVAEDKRRSRRTDLHSAKRYADCRQRNPFRPSHNGQRFRRLMQRPAQHRITPGPVRIPGNPFPLRPSSVSLDTQLLSPRSAPQTAQPGVTSGFPSCQRALLHSRGRAGIGPGVKRHPFSGPIHSAGELLHTP